MPQSLAIRPPPLGASTRLHRDDGPGKLRAGQPGLEGFPIELPPKDFLSIRIKPYNVERVLGQIDTNGDDGGFQGDLLLLRGRIDIKQQSGP